LYDVPIKCIVVQNDENPDDLDEHNVDEPEADGDDGEVNRLLRPAILARRFRSWGR
jgi:hypothetical protein